MRILPVLAVLPVLLGGGAAACDFPYPRDPRAQSIASLRRYPVVAEIRFERHLSYRHRDGWPVGVARYRIVRSWKGPPAGRHLLLRFDVQSDCDLALAGDSIHKVVLSAPRHGVHASPSSIEWYPQQDVLDAFAAERARLERQATGGDPAAAAALAAFRREWGLATR